MKKLIYWKLCAKCCFKHFPNAVLSHLILLVTVRVGILFIPVLLEEQKQRDLANCPRGKWKLDSGQQQRRRPRIYRAGVSEAGCPHCSPGSHSCSHEKQTRPMVSSRALQASEPCCQACPFHSSHVPWVAWPMPTELQWVSRRAHDSARVSG